MGIKQVYGDGAVQYLRAGKGVLHEEMWELPDFSLGTDLELFQIWVRGCPACLLECPRGWL
jgi:redox-sensitive bicupin YhaK (pirin superfamily)